LLRVMVWELDVPVATLPKLTEEGVAFRTKLTPVPDSATVDAEPVELLVIEIEPLKLPAAAGSKLTVNEVLWPALRVTGKERAEMLNPVPLTLALLMVNAAEPELVRETVLVVAVPTLTLPKLSDAGLKASTGVTPVPESATVDAEPIELLVIEIEPLLLPAAAGSKLTVNDVLWPALRVTGVERPEMLNPVPLTLA